ncbi:Y-family DNA polymerase [Photobacterium damselae]|nr:Y-family DNA polymerase [Photobacterium damselae]
MASSMITRSKEVWALVDAKNFYCSCEQLFDPSLVGKPLVVLSNNDGCCVAISQQAKALGIVRGVPWFKIQREAIQQGVKVRSSNYTLYADMSRRFIEELSRFSPHVEQYSIDEAFIRLDGFQLNELANYGREIRTTILKNIGLPVRVGIGATPTLAKLGNHAAKVYEKQVRGVIQIDTEHRRQWLLERTPIQDIWGIGAKTATRLRTAGIQNGWQLAQQDSIDIRRLWNVTLARTVLELQQISCISPGDVEEKRKQILSSRTFGQGINQLDELNAALAFHCQRAGGKLRKQQSQTGVVGVFLRTNKHKNLPQHHRSAVMPLISATQDTYRILEVAQALLNEIYRSGYEYYKVGVILEQLTDVTDDAIQLDMFDSSALYESKRRELMAVADRVNARYKNGIKPASIISSTNWHMRQAHRSNRWTTRLDELPIARC